MVPAFLFFPDEFDAANNIILAGPENQCQHANIYINDDDINEADQIFFVKINVAPELEYRITTIINVSLINIIDNDGECGTCHLEPLHRLLSLFRLNCFCLSPSLTCSPTLSYVSLPPFLTFSLSLSLSLSLSHSLSFSLSLSLSLFLALSLSYALNLSFALS